MLAILLAGLFVSCKDEMDEENKDLSAGGDEIGFCLLPDGFQKPTTRSLMESFGLGDKVSVLSMKTSDGSAWQKVFANDTVVIKNVGDVKWSYANKQKWEDNSDYKFSAFYPIKGDDFNETKGESCANGFEFSSESATLNLNNYISSKDPRENTDMLASTIVSRNYSKDQNGSMVSLDMKHMLACVDFRIKTKKGKKLHITSFTINGYAQRGNCSVNDKIEWSPIYDEALNITNGSTETVVVKFNGDSHSDILVGQNKFVFKDKGSNLPLGMEELYNNYLYTWSSKYGQFYVVTMSENNRSSESIGSAYTDGSKEETDAYSFDNYEGLLFIPQELEREGVEMNLDFSLYHVYNWGENKDNNAGKIPGVSLRHSVFADIEFYFDDIDPGVANRGHAIVDLTANGKVETWDAGVKYVYTIGMYEYQATANITIENWQPHSYEEDLR